MLNKKIKGLLIFGGLGVSLFLYLTTRIPAKEYRRLCLSFAIMDDEIARNELEGTIINGRKIEFPLKEESIVYRYELFLEMYKKHSRKEMEDERIRLIQRLEESKRQDDFRGTEV